MQTNGAIPLKDRRKPSMRAMSLQASVAALGACFGLAISAYALHERLVLNPVKRAIVSEVAPLKQKIDTHIGNPDLHMPYRDKVKEFVTREEFNRIEKDIDEILHILRGRE